MSDITSDLLAAVCEQRDKRRPAMLAPFSVTLDGERWTVATDGTRLLGLRNGPEAVEFDGYTTSIANFHRQAFAPDGIPLDVASIRDFFLAHAPAPRGKCPACNDQTGKDCEKCGGTGEHECECLECGHEHTYECKACEGSGQWTCPKCEDRDKPVKVRLGVAVFDAARHAPLMLALPDGAAVLHDGGKENLWTLSGPDWFAVFMPMRTDDRVGIPEFEPLRKCAA